MNKNTIPICMASDDNYALYIAVLVKSIIKHSSAHNTYEIIILERAISQSTKDLINNVALNVNNFTITFIDVTQYDNIFKPNLERSHLPISAFDRLLLPKIIENHDKVMYMDVDTYVRCDLADLLHIDMEDNYLIATRANGLIVARKQKRLYSTPNGKMPVDDYLKNYLNLSDPCDYFNSGILVFNIKKMQEDNLLTKFLELSNKRFKWQDQCLLNTACRNSVKYVDHSWNFFVNGDYVNFESVLNAEEFKGYRKASFNPKIVHYKHWKHPENIYAKEWWECAEELNLTSEITSRNLKAISKNKGL